MSDQPEFTPADFEALAGLDFRPACEQSIGAFGRCTNPADFTARLHCCKHGHHPMLICRGHMQEVTVDAQRAFPLNCTLCGVLFETSEDWIGRFQHL
ncbi:hypothetical protein [Rhodococcoides kyotonense]|uniref:Uncharacterized protein n=1 Tax=Rhodococcoides kyotonense TaxID=398843 RepID=A0A239FQT0_9NOCA|nr:hypothetical protein [Rhodococcus kyotonensis]SNS59149.1 hypothetical protein SAMN05421642_103411 [Rhodococcus kyotonensis]